jgi:L-fuculose-phosphate aldolase
MQAASKVPVRLGPTSQQFPRKVQSRRCSMLACLTERDLIETGLDEDDSNVVLASSEVIVHRAIYKSTSALAIVHCHPPHVVALSLIQDSIVPIDSEGSYFLHNVPVVSAQLTVGSSEVAEIMPKVLKKYKLAMLRGHGSLAIGQLLEEAYQWTSSFEESCRIIQIAHSLGVKPIKEYRKGAEQYKDW